MQNYQTTKFHGAALFFLRRKQTITARTQVPETFISITQDIPLSTPSEDTPEGISTLQSDLN